MNSHLKLSALFGAAFGLCSVIQAGTFTFEEKIVAVRVAPGTETIAIEFPFTNESDDTIEISNHATPCACLSASFKNDRKIYAPGDKGKLTAIFDLRNRYGLVEKSVVIWQKGDAPNKPSITLTAKITIPEVVSIAPRTLNWKVGAEPTPKIYTITVENDQPIRVTAIRSTNNLFASELKTIREGWEYELVVTPADTSKTSFGILKITTDSVQPRYRMMSAFAAIRP